jgi:signal peptidase I
MQGIQTPALKSVTRYIWQSWLRPLATAAAIMLPIKSALAEINWVPTGSMKPTILEGDMMFVNKLAYDLKVPFTLFHVAEWSAPQRGDVVVFFAPEDGMRLIKRVVGLPGDRVSMENNTLFLNGSPLDYSIAEEHPFADEIYEDRTPIVASEQGSESRHWVMSLPSRPAMRTFEEFTVPEGRYFMMGDSRDNSRDSRYFGCIERKQIVGKALGIAASFDKHHYYIPRFSRWFSRLDSEVPPAK